MGVRSGWFREALGPQKNREAGMGHSDVSLSLTHIQPPSGLLWVRGGGAAASGSRGEGSGRVSGSQVQRPVASVNEHLS